ncbi:MarR family winged helix-turn-helix transcriptional regulator [Phenylobacterium sp.]|jgi:DNA-binding MarR family transcriptional regulator|uniref:MarR family winged helix-turn-helix transcriptional regulator n=1 Tax=Phenylobacterium sp. TaxID=1871053 RepID=UPI003782FF0F
MPPSTTNVAPAAEDFEVELGVLNELIGFRFRRIHNHLSRGFNELAPEAKPGTFSALALIGANPGVSQTTLSREVGFDKATIVSILDGLERLGWAERRRSPSDRRRHALYITREGQKALDRLHDHARRNEAPIRQALTEEEQTQFFRILDKMYAACFPG